MKVCVAIAMTLTLAALASADSPPVPDELERFALFVMRDAPAREAAFEQAEIVDRVIRGYREPAARDLYTAMLHHLLGFVERGNGRDGESERYFELAIEFARSANERVETSEGHRVLADAYNQLLDLGGTGFRMFNVGRARQAAETAVELDPRNPLAHMAAAGFFINAPRFVGGDLVRGRSHVDTAARLGGDSEYVTFLVAVWEAKLAHAEGRTSAARAALARAHTIFPRNWWLASVGDELGIELPVR
jgi:tetratricopeptide (TPR) repeat protein